MPFDSHSRRGARRSGAPEGREHAKSHTERRLHAQRRHAQMERESLRQLRELALPSSR
jgi:hypothetical protein